MRALWSAGLLAWACVLAPTAAAQPARDPTQPPASASGAAASDAAGPRSPLDDTPIAIIVRDGRPHLVVGTRLYTQGQSIGGARIERIDETAVWLREGRQLVRRAVFTGIERRVAGAAPTPPPLPPCVPRAQPRTGKPRATPTEKCQP